MNEDEILNVEDRVYANPQIGLNETNAFIENLRQTQADDTARINQQTYALGTQVPSNLGGLSGSEATFAERYQKPQTEQMIANLKATAQAQALNQALENTLAQYKNRYKQAYRNAYAKAMTSTPTTSTSGGGLQIDTNEGTGGTHLELDPFAQANLPSDVKAYEMGYETSDEVVNNLNRINSLIGSGQLPSLGGVGITYTANGREYPAVVYTDNGKIVGVETPFQSYTGDAGINYLQGTISAGGRIKNSAGKDMTSGWQYIVTH